MSHSSIDQTFHSVLVEIVKESIESGLKTTKTHTLKLAYLVEVEFFRECGRRLTDVDWVYYKYGPYVFDYDNYFDDKCLSLAQPCEDFSLIEFNDLCEIKNPDSITRRIVKRILRQYGALSLSQLLDIVYYDTEPMLNVLRRRDRLDFSSIQACVKLRKSIIVADRTISNSILKAKTLFQNAIKL